MVFGIVILYFWVVGQNPTESVAIFCVGYFSALQNCFLLW